MSLKVPLKAVEPRADVRTGPREDTLLSAGDADAEEDGPSDAACAADLARLAAPLCAVDRSSLVAGVDRKET